MTHPKRNEISFLAGAAVLVFAALIGLIGSMVLSSRFDSPTNVGLYSGLACLFGSLASLIAVSAMSRSSEGGLVAGITFGIVVRLCSAFLAAVGMSLMGLGDRKTVGGWILYWYLIFLVVEVVWLARQLSSTSTSQEATPC